MTMNNFILCQKIGDKIIKMQITKFEYLEIEEANQSLGHIRFFLWRLKEIDLNYKDLHNSLEAYQTECKSSGLDIERIQEIFINYTT